MKKWRSENWFDLVSVVSRVLILFFAGRILGVLKGLR
jgi:hypothetical protein